MEAVKERTLVVKVPFNGQILKGQGMSPKDFDIEHLGMYAEYVYGRFISLGLGVSREDLMKELGLNEAEEVNNEEVTEQN